MPHCQHYPHCKRGDDCPYTHVQVAEDAKICKDFVGLGWCERGEKCTERHVWECPDFEEKGVCNKRGCKLGHVIRRKNAKGANEDGSKLETEPSFMFYDTNPDPSFVRDDSLALPAGARKRSASTSVASAEDYSSGEEEAANLVKKKVKIVEVPVHHKPEDKDAMQANEDYVTLVFSDVDDDDEEMLLDEEESEAESGLEEEHLDSISRKIDPTVYDEGPTGEEEDDERTESSSEDEDEDEDDDEANTTIRLGTPAKDVSVGSQPQATSSSEATDASDSESD